MYSVTDIKNVDQDKKAKQEELTAHIAELKSSIQDAEADLAKNENKYQNNVRLLSYLKNEKHRYEEEVKEIEELSASVGVTQTIKDYGCKEEDIPMLSKKAFEDPCAPGNPRDTSLEEFVELYHIALNR
jgi:alcohol dehydrogenase class IV